MEKELWKPIAGYENYCLISNLGRVKTLIRESKCGRGRFGYRKLGGNILTPRLTQKGYHRVTISTGEKRKDFYIHRLVASHFIPNPSMKKTVNHKNGDKSDNTVENLEWLSLQENIQHYVQSKRTQTEMDQIKASTAGYTSKKKS